MLEMTLASLRDTVNWSRHRLVIVDNCSEPETETDAVYEKFGQQLPFTLIRAPQNLGTARGINLAWLHRQPGEHAVKCDSDIEICDRDWACRLEDCVNRDPKLGVAGLKRTDCIERPERTDWYKSEMVLLPGSPLDRWLPIERCNHVLSACALHSSNLLDKVGYLFQMTLKWGFDDALMAARCVAVGMYSAFYNPILIRHLDPGDTDYQKQKEKSIAGQFDIYHRFVKEYGNGSRSPYHGPAD